MVHEQPDSIWLPCPQCGSRFEIRSGGSQEVRCSHCKRRFIVGPPGAGSDRPVLMPAPTPLATSAPASFENLAPKPVHTAAPAADEGYEIKVAPAVERTGYVEHIPKREEIVERPPPEEFVPPPPEASLAWAFTSGIFEYPWTRGALSQWIVLSLGLFVTAELLLFANRAFQVGGFTGVVGAGSIGVAALFIGAFVMSYAAASMVRIVENTAYNMDAEADWPDADWRDRFFHLLRILYVLVLASLVGAGVAWLISLGTDGRASMVAAQVIILLLFPVFLLATMETDSLSPISAPILRSLATRWSAWGAFYAITIVLGGCLVFASSALYGVAGALAPFVTEPTWAAAIFIYARLLGRVAWLLMNQGKSQVGRPHSIRTTKDFIFARRHERPVERE